MKCVSTCVCAACRSVYISPSLGVCSYLSPHDATIRVTYFHSSNERRSGSDLSNLILPLLKFRRVDRSCTDRDAGRGSGAEHCKPSETLITGREHRGLGVNVSLSGSYLVSPRPQPHYTPITTPISSRGGSSRHFSPNLHFLESSNS